jgi:uncharacterized RDD family membrane protein YckC
MVTFERPHPERGTEGDVVLARIAAFVTDAVAFAVVWTALAAAFGAVSETLGGIVGGVGSALFFLYFIYFEAEYGQTVGKMVMDVVVVTEGGGPVGYKEAVIRTVLRIVDILPFLYIVGLVAIYLTDREQRIGDVLADTVVLKARDKGEKL